MWKNLTPLRKVHLTLLIIFAAWLGLSLVVPFTLPSGSVTDLSGAVGRIDNQYQIERMNPLAAAIYFMGDLNCHQIADRSFYLNGNEMPFCARDTGIFFGIVFGMVLAIVVRYRPGLPLIAAGFIPTALDGGLQLVTNYSSNNPLRFATGIVAGIAAAYLLSYVAIRVMEPESLPTTRASRR
jgi:uncharacterized membrane protein